MAQLEASCDRLGRSATSDPAASTAPPCSGVESHHQVQVVREIAAPGAGEASVGGCTERASQPGGLRRTVIDVDETPIKITIVDTVITARLADNATAPAPLPPTLTLKDFNHVEKVATLPRPLSTDGVPAGADPDIGDIGYYAPSGDLVFYYGDVGYWNGIVRLGRFDTTMELIEHQDDNFRVRIERG
jgi:hypothetical protein